MGAAAVTGLQQHVIAVTKHFIGSQCRVFITSMTLIIHIANEQETNRQPGDAFLAYGIDLGYNASVSENVGDVAMHELYLVSLSYPQSTIPRF